MNWPPLNVLHAAREAAYSELSFFNDMKHQKEEGHAMTGPKGSSEAMNHAEVIRKALLRSSLPNTVYDPAIMALEALETHLEEARANSYPHMCRMDHVQIGHSVSDEDERCPVCRLIDKLAARDAELQALRETAAEQSRVHVEMHNRIVELDGKLAQQIEAYSRLATKHISTNGRLVEERDAALQRAELAESWLESAKKELTGLEREELETYRLQQQNGPTAAYYLLAEELGVPEHGSVVDTVHAALAAARKALEEIAFAGCSVNPTAIAAAALERINGEGHAEEI